MLKGLNKEKDNLPVIALVGRVNVGKSTLFNRLIEKDKALVSNIPGTTRTSNEGLVLWRGKYFKLIDTGGLTFTDDIPLEEDILKQSQKAMREADAVLFMIDAKTDILPQEKELAKSMRRIIQKPVVLVANKADSQKQENEFIGGAYYKLGLGEPFIVSAATGRRVGDLLDYIHSLLRKSKKRPKQKTEAEAIKVALIGKPNVGKSSLFNKIIGEERVIVNPMPHTTREPFDTAVIYNYQAGRKTLRQRIIFVDTAGIRRKTKVAGELEKIGIQKSIKAIEESDIILFVIDASVPLSSQDMQLGGLVEKRGKSVIILVNKWDLSEDNSDHQRHQAESRIYSHFPHLKFAPLVFVSGLTGYRAHQIMPLLIHAWEARQIEIPINALGDFLADATRRHRPTKGKGTRPPKIISIRQLRTNPPIIELAIKHHTSLHLSYVNFIENKMREQFDFFATPVIIKLRKLKR